MKFFTKKAFLLSIIAGCMLMLGVLNGMEAGQELKLRKDLRRVQNNIETNKVIIDAKQGLLDGHRKRLPFFQEEGDQEKVASLTQEIAELTSQINSYNEEIKKLQNEEKLIVNSLKQLPTSDFDNSTLAITAAEAEINAPITETALISYESSPEVLPEPSQEPSTEIPLPPTPPTAEFNEPNFEGNYYEVLGVASDASTRTITKAYRRLTLIHHPDKGSDEEKFKIISAAYGTLVDAEKRAAYDASLIAESLATEPETTTPAATPETTATSAAVAVTTPAAQRRAQRKGRQRQVRRRKAARKATRKKARKKAQQRRGTKAAKRAQRRLHGRRKGKQQQRAGRRGRARVKKQRDFKYEESLKKFSTKK